MLFPWIVTSATWPRFTSFKKSEKARVDCGPRLEEVWNRLKSATRSSPITIHRARFLPKLFTVRPFSAEPDTARRLAYSDRSPPANIFARLRDKMLPSLNNSKARAGQRIDRPEHDLRPRPDALPLEP